MQSVHIHVATEVSGPDVGKALMEAIEEIVLSICDHPTVWMTSGPDVPVSESFDVHAQQALNIVKGC